MLSDTITSSKMESKDILIEEDITEIFKQYDIEMKEEDAYPYSMQQFYKWAHFINKKQSVIDLDFDKIEDDIKYQYNSYYNQDPNKFKQIYYNYDEENEHSIIANKIFGKWIDSVIHYIYKELYPYFYSLDSKFKLQNEEDFMKSVKQSGKIMQLFFKYDIINGDEIYEEDTTIYEIKYTIKSHLDSIDSMDEKHRFYKYQQQLMDIDIDILLSFLQHKKHQNEAIFTLQYIGDDSNDDECWMIENIVEDSFMMNKNKYIEKFIYHGIRPFFVNIDKEEFHKLFKDNISKSVESCNSEIMAMTCPLIIYSYLEQIRQQIFAIIIQQIGSNYKELTNFILDFLFINDKFEYYDKHSIKKNAECIKLYEFANWIKHTSIDKQIFNDKFNNYQFAKCIFNQKRNSRNILTQFIRRDESNLEYLYELINFYPPKLKDCYYLIFGLIGALGRDFKYIIPILKKIKSVYGEEFDINYIWTEDDYKEYDMEITGYFQHYEHEKFGYQNMLISLLAKLSWCGGGYFAGIKKDVYKSQEFVDLINYFLDNNIDIYKENIICFGLREESGFMLYDILLKYKQFQQFPLRLMRDGAINYIKDYMNDNGQMSESRLDYTKNTINTFFEYLLSQYQESENIKNDDCISVEKCIDDIKKILDSIQTY